MSNISKHLVTKIQNNSIAHAWDEAVKEWGWQIVVSTKESPFVAFAEKKALRTYSPSKINGIIKRSIPLVSPAFAKWGVRS